MLGTVYAGCCYSVLDTRQPASRTLQVLDTLTPAFLVTDEAHAAAAAALGYSGQIIRLDDLLAAPADAALLAARRSRKAITMEDIEEASMKVMAGPEKKSRVVTAEEKKLTAYHEAGHAVQYAVGYSPIRLRNAIVPLTQVGATAAMPLILMGLVLNFGVLIKVGIIAFALSTVFQLVTLPVEINASRRALAAIGQTHMLDEDEYGMAKKTLTAAAMTYVAALAVSLAQLLRLLLIFGGRNRDDR